jgi:pimeloyl-ACP methyl ester carboxylesterase
MFQPRKSLLIAAALLLGAWPAYAGGSGTGQTGVAQRTVPPPENANLFAGMTDPAQAMLEGLKAERRKIEKSGDVRLLDAWLDQVRRLEHRVPVGDGYELAVTETFTLRSWLRLPHRAVLFLCGSVFRGNHFSIPVEGYDGSAMVAERDGFAFTVDYIGVGGSTIPANGRLATYELQREAMRKLVSYIRFFRAVPKVDLVGDGFGGSIAAELAADGSRIRSASMSAMIYRQVNGGPLNDPAFIALLNSSPDGYFPVPGDGSLVFMTGAPQAAKDFVAATQGGFYPIDNFLVAADRPFFNPASAQAPGLIFYGPNDFIAVASDIEDLAAEYGSSGATLAINPAAGHAPRTEGPAVSGWYWSTLFDFIDL